MQTEGELVNTQEAIKIFINAGLSESTFHRRVKSGKIEKIMPTGKQRGALYPNAQVLACIAAEKKANLKVKNTRTYANIKSAKCVFARPEDMDRLAPLIEELFGSYPAIERWRSWIEKNPSIALMLISENEVVGCGFLMPLTEEKIIEVFGSEVTPAITANDVQTYEPGKDMYVYARTIGVTQRHGHVQKRVWASILVRNLMKTIISMGQKGIEIQKIYGRNDTTEGLKLMRNMGFTQIRTTTTHKNFVIDVETSGLEMVLRYEQALNEWKQRYAGDPM